MAKMGKNEYICTDFGGRNKKTANAFDIIETIASSSAEMFAVARRCGLDIGASIFWMIFPFALAIGALLFMCWLMDVDLSGIL